MYEVLQRMKGISCILFVLSFQTDTSDFKYQAEALEFLSQGLNSCIEELEKMKKIMEQGLTKWGQFVLTFFVHSATFFVVQPKNQSPLSNVPKMFSYVLNH